MKTHVPEDLSSLPDAHPDQATTTLKERALPEDVSALPEAPTGEPPAAKAPRPKTPMRHGRALTLLVAALLALALLAAAMEVSGLISASYGVHPALGWAAAALVALCVALLGLIVAREVEGYVRLSSFEQMKATFDGLRRTPADHALHGRAQREVERFLRCLEQAADPALLLKTQRLRDRMDLADTPAEWGEDIERILLADMDEEARDVIRREAVNVALGTALSPYGVLDAVIVIWRNVRMVRRIAGVYRVRAGAYGTWLILRRAVAAAALADLAQEASVALLGTTRSLASVVGAPLAQGLANAAMTVRVGLKALEECRPLRLPKEQRVGIVKTLMSSVTSAVRRLSPAKPRDANPAE